jgi:serine/threonine protein kinase
MTQEPNHALLEKFFDQALSLDSPDRESWLKTVRQSHPGLHGPLLSLLKAHTTRSAFLTREPAGILTKAPCEAPSTIAHYTLEELIGEGVSGKVFRALDNHLKRPVAIKWIPDKGSRHEIFQRNVQQEAELLASLEHPNIAAIYGVEHSDRDHAIVMEYIDGHTLEERLQQGPLPLDEAIKMAASISHALEAAHAKRIVHRDLKPENIKINSRHEIKVLDFGLSALITDLHGLPVEPAVGEETLPEKTSASLLTQTAVIMGTLPYLSPEQARGRPLDQRSDIWSFGCVLFEMLTGKCLFQGQDPVETLSNILKAEIPWETLPPETPKKVRWLLEKCLRRDFQRRLPDIGAARLDLEDTLLELEEASPQLSPLHSFPQKRAMKGAIAWGLAGAILLFLSITYWPVVLDETRIEANSSIPQTPLTLPIYFTEPTDETIDLRYLLVTPKNRSLIIRSHNGLWEHPLDHFGKTKRLYPEFVQEPFFSPEGDHIAYVEKNKLLIHSLTNNQRTVVSILKSNVTPNHGGGLWKSNGDLIFNTGDEGLYQVNLHSHEEAFLILPTTSKDDNFHEATALPDQKGVLFITHRRHHAIDTVTLWSEETGRKDLLELTGHNLRNPTYAPSGHVVFVVRNASKKGLWAFPFDLDTLTRTGDIFNVSDEASGGLAISSDNTLIFTRNKPSHPFRLRWLHPEGDPAAYLEGTLDRTWISGMDLSSDQKHLLFGDSNDISLHFWQHNFARKTSSRIKSRSSVNRIGNPLWTLDNQLIYNEWDALGVRTLLTGLNYADSPQTLCPGYPVNTSSSGRFTLIQGLPRWGRHSYIDMESEQRAPQPFPPHLDDMWNPTLSHDERWMAFVSGEQRKDDAVYVVGFPDASIRYVINQGHKAIHPFWHPTQNTLFYIDPDGNALYSTDFRPDPAPAFSPPVKVLDLPANIFLGNTYTPHMMLYVSTNDRFLYIENQAKPESISQRIQEPDALLIQNWYHTLGLSQ